METLERLLGGAGVLLCPSPAVPLSCRGKGGLNAGRDGAGSHLSIPDKLFTLASLCFT